MLSVIRAFGWRSKFALSLRFRDVFEIRVFWSGLRSQDVFCDSRVWLGLKIRILAAVPSCVLVYYYGNDLRQHPWGIPRYLEFRMKPLIFEAHRLVTIIVEATSITSGENPNVWNYV